MPTARFLPLLISLLGLAACGEDHPPTGPSDSAAPGAELGMSTAGRRVVTSLADPGNGICNTVQCTLREAINDPGSTDITFVSGLAGTITLAAPAKGGGELVIKKSLTISAPASGITVRRRSTDPAFRILRIVSAVTVSLTNLTLRGGKIIDQPGGGIINFGSLALTRCTVTDNLAPHGGGIESHGPLTLTNSTLANNSGGGVENHNNATLTIKHSTVTRNLGVGVTNIGSTLVVLNSTVSDNSGTGVAVNRGMSTLTTARIVGNKRGGIRVAVGDMTVTKSTVARNLSTDGGGIANFGGNLTITNTTVTGNSATGHGGGIYNTTGDPNGRGGASLTLTNSTVSGNSAAVGGGIDNLDKLGGARLTATNSTVALNSAHDGGGGIHQGTGVETSNSIALINSLVAKNTAPSGADVLGESVENESRFFVTFSVIGDGRGSSITNADGNQVGNVAPNTSSIDPLLGPLALNGGPTRTHALLPGSPALDAASTADCPPTDQRGVARPQGAGCDSGSYELE